MFRQRTQIRTGEFHRDVTVCSSQNLAGVDDFVLFCADGQNTEAFASEYFNIHPDDKIWFVGADSSAEHRNDEYVLGRDLSRFETHEQFFTEALLQFTETLIGLRHNRRRAAVFGYSCGGAFAASMGIRHPEKYGVIFAFSVAGTPVANLDGEAPSNVADVSFYFRSGSREPGSMRKYMARLGKWLNRGSAQVDIAVEAGGHEFPLWSQALNDALHSVVSSETKFTT